MELRPYQKRIANWLCQHPHACLGDLKENNDQTAADYIKDDEMELPY